MFLVRTLVCITCIALLASNARAQPAPGTPANTHSKPWWNDTTAAQRTRAGTILGRADQLFLAGNFPAALAAYRRALGVWDHPKIRNKIARTLIKLDRLVEAFVHVKAALRYGRSGLEQRFAEAKGNERMLAARLAQVQVSCTQTGVSIVVDGRPFLSCPGSREAHLRPGAHRIVGERPGHLTKTRELRLAAGATVPVTVSLLSIADAVPTKRRWPLWKPMAVLGAGVVASGIGLLFELDARTDRAAVQDMLDQSCPMTPCPPVTSADLSWRRKHIAGASLLVAGGGLLVTGIVLALLNRSRRVLPGAELTATVSRARAGLRLVYRY